MNTCRSCVTEDAQVAVDIKQQLFFFFFLPAACLPVSCIASCCRALGVWGAVVAMQVHHEQYVAEPQSCPTSTHSRGSASLQHDKDACSCSGWGGGGGLHTQCTGKLNGRSQVFHESHSVSPDRLDVCPCPCTSRDGQLPAIHPPNVLLVLVPSQGDVPHSVAGLPLVL